MACAVQKKSRLAPRVPLENELVEQKWTTLFLRFFRPFFFILGEFCPGLVLVASPVAKCAYKQHRYRNNCVATGSMYTWALSVGGASPPLMLSSSAGKIVCPKFDHSSINFYVLTLFGMQGLMPLSITTFSYFELTLLRLGVPFSSRPHQQHTQQFHYI